MPTLILHNLQTHLTAQGITHAQLAQALQVPEAKVKVKVKRMFERNECSTQRIFDICEWLQIDFADLIERQPKKRGTPKIKTEHIRNPS